jgi:NAD-dependent DNA ligase
MPTDQLKRILLAKSNFTEEQIASMSERDGWDWVYSHKPASQPKQEQICFTGFTDEEKAELAALAAEHGMTVVTAVTKHLKYLCIGEYPGPKKLEKALRQGGVQCLSAEELKLLVTTGEVPA